MGTELNILIISAASIGFLHTLLGPDHYLPFVMMAKARKWTTAKTLWITGISGLGHVASSVILGAIGISIGVAVTSLESIEASRGGIAAWFLIAFGLVYFVYGMRRAIKGKKHSHLHVHEDGTYHKHEHTHVEEHVHVHDGQPEKKEITPWVLFVIFLLGPCEPLIPLLMYPAAKTSWQGVALVALVFSVVTIGTMIGSVVVLLAGSRFLPKTSVIERYMHAIAGAMIFMCGASIEFLGL
jgi:ABC-type nickel/cobalt efflux system permease component RcnA